MQCNRKIITSAAKSIIQFVSSNVQPIKKDSPLQTHELFFLGRNHIISHVGSGIVPVDGVGRISYGHCLYHTSPFRSITCILFPQSVFLHLILYLLFHVCFGLKFLRPKTVIYPRAEQIELNFPA